MIPKPKPEYLEGEVKEFIKVISKTTKIDFMGETTAMRAFCNAEDLADLADFYEQNFFPEMITEYFKGWKKESKVFPKYRNENIGEFRMYDVPGSYWGINDYEKSWQEQWTQFQVECKTLSQFITNCIQAGIKLEWK